MPTRDVYLLTGATVGFSTNISSTSQWGLLVGDTVWQMPNVGGNKSNIAPTPEPWTSAVQKRFKDEPKYVGKTSLSNARIDEKAEGIVRDLKSYNLITRNCQELAQRLANAILDDGNEVEKSRTIGQHLLNAAGHLSQGSVYGVAAPPSNKIRDQYNH